MKVIKGLAIFCFLSILLGSCFEPPEFPDQPQISFEDIYFCETESLSKPDSLVLTINFKDGDGNLGLHPQNPLYFTDPFHYGEYFQDVNGSLVRVPTNVLPVGLGSTFLDYLTVAAPESGDLIFPRTKKRNPAYSYLPPYSCSDYQFRDFIIHISDTAVLDKFSKRIDTLKIESGTYYVYQDTLYIVRNPNHFNIEVDFLVKTDPGNINPDLRFTEYDWVKEKCEGFDGRFPFLSESGTSLDGQLRYDMLSGGFLILFGGNTMKLRIQIRDRSLNVSNVIETPEFTLASIRRCR
jgi:hypothetical protein